jgi:hypothetical protein
MQIVQPGGSLSSLIEGNDDYGLPAAMAGEADELERLLDLRHPAVKFLVDNDGVGILGGVGEDKRTLNDLSLYVQTVT